MIEVKVGKILNESLFKEKYMIIHLGIIFDEETSNGYNLLKIKSGYTVFATSKTKIGLEKFINSCNFSEEGE